MQPAMKECPQCRQFSPLAAAKCDQCGHIFRTKFPPLNQTQMVAPLQQTQAVPTLPTPTATSAPRDNTERLVSILWHAAGLFISGLLLCAVIPYLVQAIEEPDIYHQLYLLCALLACIAAASFCVMRLRRLYLYHSGAQQPWWQAVVLIVILMDVLIALLTGLVRQPKAPIPAPGITFHAPASAAPVFPAVQPPIPLESVRPGMSRSQVREQLGLPDSTQAYPNGECWIYTLTHGTQTVCFTGDSVAEVHTHTETESAPLSPP